MRSFGPALALCALLLLPAVLAHDNCVVDVDPTATVETPAATYYVIDERCQFDGCLFSLWVFEESNGIAGLQTDLFRDPARVCYPHTTPGDTILF